MIKAIAKSEQVEPQTKICTEMKQRCHFKISSITFQEVVRKTLKPTEKDYIRRMTCSQPRKDLDSKSNDRQLLYILIYWKEKLSNSTFQPNIQTVKLKNRQTYFGYYRPTFPNRAQIKSTKRTTDTSKKFGNILRSA